MEEKTIDKECYRTRKECLEEDDCTKCPIWLGAKKMKPNKYYQKLMKYCNCELKENCPNPAFMGYYSWKCLSQNVSSPKVRK